MGVYLKSTVHCINGARSKLLGPDVLLHVNTEALAKKGNKLSSWSWSCI